MTRVSRTAKWLTFGALARAVSMTIASAHPAALAVHSGSVTDTPRPECAGEMGRSGAPKNDFLIERSSGTATTGPNSNNPVFFRRRLATNSASV